MRRILPLLLMLTLWLSASAEPTVVALPEGCICLDIVTLPDGEHLLLLGDEPENAVRLAATNGGVITATTGPLLALDDYDPELTYFTIDWRSGNPIFWWGTSNIVQTRELYMRLEKAASGDWIVAGGYVDDPFQPLKYSFFLGESGTLAINGETVSPQIVWPTDFSMALDGFNPAALEQVCLGALAYLADFCMNHTVDEQDEKYRINW